MKGYKEFQELIETNFADVLKNFKPLPHKKKDKQNPRRRDYRYIAGKVNRIAARLKFVKSFDKIEANNYSSETLTGYNGLFKVFITFSAFEGFIQLFPEVNEYEVEEGFNDYAYSDISDKVRALDAEHKLLSFLELKADSPKLKERIRKFTKGENKPLNIAKTIRHIFAHGKLTPNAKDANPKDVAKICDVLCDLMLIIMDTEFEKKIRKIKEELDSQNGERATS